MADDDRFRRIALYKKQSWPLKLYKGVRIYPQPINQGPFKTCGFCAVAKGAEMSIRRQYADAGQSCDIVVCADTLITDYCAHNNIQPADIGTKEKDRNLFHDIQLITWNLGLLARSSKWESPVRIKANIIRLALVDEARMFTLLSQGKPLVAPIVIEPDFHELQADAVYSCTPGYDEEGKLQEPFSYHAVLLVACEGVNKPVTFLNSHTPETFGDGGYGHIMFAHVLKGIYEVQTRYPLSYLSEVHPSRSQPRQLMYQNLPEVDAGRLPSKYGASSLSRLTQLNRQPSFRKQVYQNPPPQLDAQRLLNEDGASASSCLAHQKRQLMHQNRNRSELDAGSWCIKDSASSTSMLAYQNRPYNYQSMYRYPNRREVDAGSWIKRERSDASIFGLEGKEAVEHHYIEKEKEALKRKLKARMECAKFLQDAANEMAKEVQTSCGGETKQTAEDLDEFLNKVKKGESVSNDEILNFAKLFNDQLNVDNMSRPRLENMCECMDIQALGSDYRLRFMIRKKLCDIKIEDEQIQAKGVESLSEEKLRQACRERGYLGLLSREEMCQQLRDWLDLSLNHAMPSALFVLSRAFTASGKTKPEEAVVAILSSLPDEVVDTVGTVLPFEDSVSERRGKLEFFEMQEEFIKEEEKKKEKEEKAKQKKEEKGLEKEINDVDVQKGNRWQLLDKHHDVKVTHEEVAAALSQGYHNDGRCPSAHQQPF